LQTGEKLRRVFSGSWSINGFGRSYEFTRDANESSLTMDKNEPIQFNKDAVVTHTEKVEVPFSTWETTTKVNITTGKKITKSAHKIPVVAVKASFIIGVDVSIDMNNYDRVGVPFPMDPFKASSDNTRNIIKTPILLR
jgi:hypothetical protein